MRGMETVATWLAYILDTPARQAKRRRDAFFARNPRPENGRMLPPITKEEVEKQLDYAMGCIRSDRKEREERARSEANGLAA